MYPCNDNEMLNFVCIHPDSESQASKGDGTLVQLSLGVLR